MGTAIEPDQGPRLKLVQTAVPPLRPRPALTAARATHIKTLISQLAEVDKPDVGYSQTYGGLAFLPVPGQEEAFVLTWTKHGQASSRALRELVAIGPEAMPFLLDALGDKTPTRLTFSHSEDGKLVVFGKTWFSDELPRGNPLNLRETRVARPRIEKAKESPHVPKYTVRIGDLCFVAIAQIVGRPYMMARYQMTSCTVLNSPVEDATLRERIRAIWKSDDPVRMVYDSLWTDYRTIGLHDDPNSRPFGGSNFQTRAALRLLYYFPEESIPVIVPRIKTLKVAGETEGEEAFVRQGIANGGIYADEFVHAVAWSKVPEVREAVRDVFRRTTDIAVFEVSLAAFDETETGLIMKKADELMTGLPAEENMNSSQIRLLSVLARRVGAASIPLFRRSMTNASPIILDGIISMLHWEVEGEWLIPLLSPLLDDTRATDRQYTLEDPKQPEFFPARDEDDRRPKVPVRVCDVAAEALAKRLPGERFPIVENQATLDRYVARLKAKLAPKQPEEPPPAASATPSCVVPPSWPVNATSCSPASCTIRWIPSWCGSGSGPAISVRPSMPRPRLMSRHAGRS